MKNFGLLDRNTQKFLNQFVKSLCVHKMLQNYEQRILVIYQLKNLKISSGSGVFLSYERISTNLSAAVKLSTVYHQIVCLIPSLFDDDWALNKIVLVLIKYHENITNLLDI